MCTNLDTGAGAGPEKFLPHESIGTPSVCTVSKVQNEVMSWLPPACLQVPHSATFAIGMHVMLGLDREHGMQLECALVHIFVNIVRITQ
jgi:hypothetical protein